MNTQPTVGVTSYGVHLPIWRLHRKAIGAALGSGGGRDTLVGRILDEDSTSTVSRPARVAVAEAAAPAALVFATATPAYADKTKNERPRSTRRSPPLGRPAADYVGLGAISAPARWWRHHAAAAGPRPWRSSPTCAPACRFRRRARRRRRRAAIVRQGDDVIAALVGRGSASAEFLDRWRVRRHVEPRSGRSDSPQARSSNSRAAA